MWTLEPLSTPGGILTSSRLPSCIWSRRAAPWNASSRVIETGYSDGGGGLGSKRWPPIPPNRSSRLIPRGPPRIPPWPMLVKLNPPPLPERSKSPARFQSSPYRSYFLRESESESTVYASLICLNFSSEAGSLSLTSG